MIIYWHGIERKVHTVHTRDPKIGVKRSTRLAAKRDKMVSVAALLLFGGEVRKVEGKLIGSPIRKGNICKELEEKPSLKRDAEDGESMQELTPPTQADPAQAYSLSTLQV